MNCDNPYSNTQLKTQADVAETTLYELLVIAAKSRQPIRVIESIVSSLQSIERLKEWADVKHRLSLNGEVPFAGMNF